MALRPLPSAAVPSPTAFSTSPDDRANAATMPTIEWRRARDADRLQHALAERLLEPQRYKRTSAQRQASRERPPAAARRRREARSARAATTPFGRRASSTRPRHDAARRAEPLVRVLGEADAHLAPRAIHAAARDVGEIGEVRSESRRGAASRASAMPSWILSATARCPPAAKYAARATIISCPQATPNSGMLALAHGDERQKAEQHEVNQRHDEPLPETDGDLPRYAAQQRGTRTLARSAQAPQRAGRRAARRRP